MMSTEEDKYKHSTRMARGEAATRRQLNILKSHLGDSSTIKEMKEPHRLAKHHAMNCGVPNCHMCGNPRKIFGEKTIQEQRFEQTKLHDEE